MKALTKIIVFVVPLMMAAPSRAQVPPVPDIPKQVIVPGQRAQLEKLRNALVQQLAQLQADAAALGAKCTHVENGTSLYNECVTNQAKVQTKKDAYIQAVKDFEKKLEPPEPLEAHSAAVGSCTGDVQMVLWDGRKIALSSGMTVPLDSKPHLKTGPDGHIQLLLPDETVFTLGHDADLVVDEFVYDPNPSKRQIAAQLVKGLFRWVTGKLGQDNPENMKVRFAVGWVGPRGTDFETYVARDRSGFVKVYAGRVQITPSMGGTLFEVGAGKEVAFTADGAFSVPRALINAPIACDPEGIESFAAEAFKSRSKLGDRTVVP